MESLRRQVGLAVAVLCLALAVPAIAAPERPSPLNAAVRGQVIDAPGTEAQAEIVTFSDELAASLLLIPLEGEVRIEGWPVAPGKRADVSLIRFDVYAPDAKIWIDDGENRTEAPRSRLLFFRGQAEDDPESRIFLTVDPDTATLSGFTAGPDGSTQDLRPLRDVQLQSVVTGKIDGSAVVGLEHGAGEKYLVAPPEPLSDRPWTCDQESVLPELLEPRPEVVTTQPIFADPLPSVHSATIAVDTDNELMNLKFGGNTTSATNYIATLFAHLTLMYERDLLVRLLQGYTILRTGTNTDPYTPDGLPRDKLSELGVHWKNKYAGVPRAAVAMLSGRGDTSPQGVAWLNGLCNKTFGYSYSVLFFVGTSVHHNEVTLVGHEIGHNFGSPHTHCYNPPLDYCWGTESGCYSGWSSCPVPSTINGVTGVTGTVMSYCTQLFFLNCGASNVFHPGTVALLQSIMPQRINNCLYPVDGPPPPTISTINPKFGPWLGGTTAILTGTNFQDGATVTFGSTAATSVTFDNSSQLTVTTPAAGSGTLPVTVTNPGGASYTMDSGFFFSSPSPVTDFYTIPPCRLLDTRAADYEPLGPSASRYIVAVDRCGISPGASAIAANVTAFHPTAPGSLNVFPGDAFDFGLATLSFKAGEVRANSSLIGLGHGGIHIRNNSDGNTHVIVDVFGYFETSHGRSRNRN